MWANFQALWAFGWRVRSEDVFLDSYTWVIAYWSILLWRRGSGRQLALLGSHVFPNSQKARHYSQTWKMLKKYRVTLCAGDITTHPHGCSWLHPWPMKSYFFWPISRESYFKRPWGVSSTWKYTRSPFLLSPEVLREKKKVKLIAEMSLYPSFLHKAIEMRKNSLNWTVFPHKLLNHFKHAVATFGVSFFDLFIFSLYSCHTEK